jgi:hypothetical protein
MICKARDPSIEDEIQVQVYGEVVAVTPVANGKRIKVKLALVDQAQLEFTDASCVLEFLCPPSRKFLLWNNYGYGNDDNDDDGDDGNDPIPPPRGADNVPAI